MRRLFFAIIISIVISVLVGVGLQYCLLDTPFQHHAQMPLLRPIIISAHFYSLLIPILFFYIRRWDGCIEKLGGALFTFIIYLATVVPLYFLNNFFDENFLKSVNEFAVVVFFQMAFIGFISTHFLRTKNFNPPKPRQPLRW